MFILHHMFWNFPNFLGIWFVDSFWSPNDDIPGHTLDDDILDNDNDVNDYSDDGDNNEILDWNAQL